MMPRPHEFFETLKGLNLPADDFAIFGSAPLFVRGIINEMNDLDVICRGDAWREIEAKGMLEYLEDYDVTIATILGGDITFGTRWGIGNPNINQLIDNAEWIDDLPFVQLSSVIEYKRLRANAKDLEHIRLIQKSDIGIATDH